MKMTLFRGLADAQIGLAGWYHHPRAMCIQHVVLWGVAATQS
jgi:hypothetical protein